MAMDFNLFFDFGCTGWESYLKKKSLAELIEFKETYELCDIWRVRYTNSKQLPFTQKYSPGFIQRGVDYILPSNTIQVFVTMTEILA